VQVKFAHYLTTPTKSHQSPAAILAPKFSAMGEVSPPEVHGAAFDHRSAFAYRKKTFNMMIEQGHGSPSPTTRRNHAVYVQTKTAHYNTEDNSGNAGKKGKPTDILLTDQSLAMYNQMKVENYNN